MLKSSFCGKGHLCRATHLLVINQDNQFYTIESAPTDHASETLQQYFHFFFYKYGIILPTKNSFKIS